MCCSDRHQPLLVVGMIVSTFVPGHALAQTLVDLPVGTAGSLEQLAQPITLDNPLPSRLLGGPPVYPGEAMGSGAAGTMVFRLLVDDTGTVAEARYLGHDRYALREVKGRLEAAPMLDSTFLAVSEDALRGWLYEPPVAAPVAIDVEFAFSGSGKVRLVWQKAADLFEPTFLGDDAAIARIAERAVEEGVDPKVPPLQTSHPDAVAVGTVVPPTRVKGRGPDYPPDALAQHVEGTVLIEILIDATGHVADTRVLRAAPQLAAAAIDAIRHWEFAPTLVDGQPTPVIMTTAVNFTLPR
jgi:protein TonB